MIKLTSTPVIRKGEHQFVGVNAECLPAHRGSMAAAILERHNQGGAELLRLRFDAAVSPDNNYTSILQTIRAVSDRPFSLPWILTNCHNTLAATGGTINEDDHAFGLSNAKKYGGVFLPPYRGVIHQYMREQWARCGSMILGSDSHTRYGALGAMGIGEGGGEIAKQVLGLTYDILPPAVIAVSLSGRLCPGVGPQDVALALIGAVFRSGFVKNGILEFCDGVSALSMDSRLGIDAMTTECGALSSIWRTDDDAVVQYFIRHGRQQDYASLVPEPNACYDGLIQIDLSEIEPMIALPFHPSNVYPIRALCDHPEDILYKVEQEAMHTYPNTLFSLRDKVQNGRLTVQQALISGCCGGTFENISAVADILDGFCPAAGDLTLGINPASLPVQFALEQRGIAARLTLSGVMLRPCICGPCFGVTDTPANNTLSARHVTRNYPLREGAKPGQGQLAGVVLMDARSIAATVRNKGRLTGANELLVNYRKQEESFEQAIYGRQVYNGYGHPNADIAVQKGPGIADWPDFPVLPAHLLVYVTGSYDDSLTTDDLIPSGEASSYRSNPKKISDFLLSSYDPAFVKRAKQVAALAAKPDAEYLALLTRLAAQLDCETSAIGTGGLLVARSLGDGSSREQAASSQKVLGGWANLAESYATKRYRSNLINWGILPLVSKTLPKLQPGDFIVLPNIRAAIEAGATTVTGQLSADGAHLSFTLPALTEQERQILLSGGLIGHYRHKQL